MAHRDRRPEKKGTPKRKDWLARTIAANIPSREELEKNRFLRPVAHRVLAPELWRFTRRSVPRGTALGLFVGIFLMIPGLQIAGAALLALSFRANVPVAAAMTFLSNPATTPFILYASLWLGNFMLGRTADLSGFMALIDSSAGVAEWTGWLFSEAAPALVVGLFVISAITAVVGWAISILFWRLRTAAKWKMRHRFHRHD
ncbi:DUF2062 domain-containing protein [Sphingomonas baiyangensis]|uniref:DUF2062 domain-containing protein n=1 Tax=Sphingomonas baiyangensis TaxID=2572576 RepID=A0A4U1L4H1_9SPHN|nr:DUF2062 domain-containing protein [Sphingomonas baiyangensis]TKD51103.1 DUF2062 domain-containing protein [Sphingomonas baiyangensis]